jgi:serine protease AprX
MSYLTSGLKQVLTVIYFFLALTATSSFGAEEVRNPALEIEPPAPGTAAPGLAGVDANHDRIADALEARMAAARPGEQLDVIVVFDGPNAVGRARAAAGPFAVTRQFSLINGFQAKMPAAQIRALSSAPGLLRVEENALVHMHDVPANDDTGATAARADLAYDGSGTTICILDTGITAGHEQFDAPAGKIVAFKDFVANQTSAYDDQGHGTHVAGIAAGDGVGASGYAAEAIGVAPGASLAVGKVLSSSGSGTTAQIVSGIEWCVGLNDIDIISMSLGGSPTDGTDALSVAVNCAADSTWTSGCGEKYTDQKIVVVSAGNSGPNPGTVGTPGVAELAITVGAFAEWSGDPADSWQDDGVYLNPFSSRGPVSDGRLKPDISAPGSRVLSAYNGSATSYAIASGTSMSAPHVAGVIALMLDADSSLGISDEEFLPHQKVRKILTDTAIDRGPIDPDPEFGAGLVDAYAAVARAQGHVVSATTFPGYTKVTDETDIGGNWNYPFVVTESDLAAPIAATMTIHGENVCVFEFWGMCFQYAWSPDLELVVEQEANDGSWSEVVADTSGSPEITRSECSAYGECGASGRVELVHFFPTVTGNYRFRVYPATVGGFGAPGSFDFEISMGAPQGGGTENTLPTASFSVSCTDLTCDFTDTSKDDDGSITGWSWDFGDEATSTAQNPSRTYAAAGTYTVTLTVTDDDGATDSEPQSVTVTEPMTNAPPTASFTSVCTDLTCDFTDTSKDDDGSITGWSWDFGDEATSTAQNPSRTYAAAGTYTVTLTVTDDDGATDSEPQSVTVTEPVTDFTLVATGYKFRGLQKADLTWSGATSTNVDVYRNGGMVRTTPNDGEYTDNIDQRGGGSYIYQVCEAGTDTCSNESIVTF